MECEMWMESALWMESAMESCGVDDRASSVCAQVRGSDLIDAIE